ncbi:hypothetical protein C7121_23905 [Paenibacillus glucanolyticus]|jgi:integrase/recombinase XerD|nr:hypothetical protein C7121_23905 [Paenibacillus glucanolyticus]MPY17088.1 tyrosine-type recombinase/integrase [Paenibacillus glucanolyticus]
MHCGFEVIVKKTIKAYCSQVHRFHTFEQQKNNGMGHENMIQSYSLHLLHRKCSHSYVNQALSAIKFYAHKVLLHEETVSYVRPKKEKKLPNVLSMNEVMLILKALHNLKHRAILYLTYSSGLRVGEVVRLKLKTLISSEKHFEFLKAKAARIVLRYYPIQLWILFNRIYDKKSLRSGCSLGNTQSAI